jgi:hypothetical protein
VLQVAPTASVAEVRRAYVRLARRHHPDFHVGASASERRRAEREMQRLNQAWEVLRDPAQRRDLDERLRLDRLRAWAPGTAHPDFEPLEPDDLDDRGRPVDADLLDDTPLSASRVPPWQQLLPAVLFLAAVLFLSAGLVASFAPLLALGVTALVCSGLSFVLVPMLTVLRSHDPDPER